MHKCFGAEAVRHSHRHTLALSYLCTPPEPGAALDTWAHLLLPLPFAGEMIREPDGLPVSSLCAAANASEAWGAPAAAGWSDEHCDNSALPVMCRMQGGEKPLELPLLLSSAR
jgi:hypothetical protein